MLLVAFVGGLSPGIRTTKIDTTFLFELEPAVFCCDFEI